MSDPLDDPLPAKLDDDAVALLVLAAVLRVRMAASGDVLAVRVSDEPLIAKVAPAGTAWATQEELALACARWLERGGVLYGRFLGARRLQLFLRRRPE